MIRFLPDNWREMLLRPIALAAPDAGVYIEIMAPDFRFAFALALILVMAVLWLLKRNKPQHAPMPSIKATALLLTLIALAFVPWLATTANGRYFIPFLLSIGPLSIALAWHMPMTREFRLTVAIGLLAFQAFVVQQSNPWQSWGLAQWKEPPFFDIELPKNLTSESSSYVSISSISYSLIAPRLPPLSQWMSLANAPGAAIDSLDSQRAQTFLKRAALGRLTLLAPAVPDYSTPDGMPDTELVRVLNTQLAAHRLKLRDPHGCQLLRSRGLASMAFRNEALTDPFKTKKMGFWACPLQYPVDVLVAPKTPQSGIMSAVFAKLEQQCPRFFAPGQTATISIPGGEMRIYAASEMKVYVMESGPVLYKYYRTFNPVEIGTISNILSGAAKVDCNNIRGRSGMPWEREI